MHHQITSGLCTALPDIYTATLCLGASGRHKSFHVHKNALNIAIGLLEEVDVAGARGCLV